MLIRKHGSISQITHSKGQSGDIGLNRHEENEPGSWPSELSTTPAYEQGTMTAAADSTGTCDVLESFAGLDGQGKMVNGNPKKHRNEHFTPVSLTCCSLFCAMRSSTSSIFSWITSWYTWFICRHVSGSCGKLLSISSSLLSSSFSISLKQIRHFRGREKEDRKMFALKTGM